MGETFAVALTGRLKHGAIVQGLQRKGWTQADLARALKTSPSELGRIVNMDAAPSARWLTDERQRVLFDLTGMLPEDLWPEWYRSPDFLSKNKRVVAVVDAPVRQLLSSPDVRRLAAPSNPEQDAYLGELRARVRDSLNWLRPREEQVLRLRFGLDDDCERSQEEIADQLGLSPQRVSAIQASAMRRLRKPWRVKALRPLY